MAEKKRRPPIVGRYLQDEVALANRGATQRTLDKLMEMLNRAQHRAS